MRALTSRPWLDRISPYQAGRHAATDAGSMASNESPLGCSDAVVAAIADAGRTVHRYPDPLATALREDLAVVHGVDPDQILVGNGSDELIYLLATAYLAAGGRAVCADPPYRIDEISTLVADGRLVRIPLADWTHDLDAMAAVDADIAYVVNPHNPTGTLHTRADISRFVDTAKAALTVVDEAYIDFVDEPAATTAIPLVGSGRVAVLRTFSKLYGLAGLRVGYLVASSDVITTLRKIRAPFSVNTVAQAGARAALHDTVHAERVRAYVREVRTDLTRVLRAAGLSVVPSQANFVLARVGDERTLVDTLWERGVTVRPGSALGIPGTVRFSVPSREGLRLLEDALGRIPDITTERRRRP